MNPRVILLATLVGVLMWFALVAGVLKAFGQTPEVDMILADSSNTTFPIWVDTTAVDVPSECAPLLAVQLSNYMQWEQEVNVGINNRIATANERLESRRRMILELKAQIEYLKREIDTRDRIIGQYVEAAMDTVKVDP